MRWLLKSYIRELRHTVLGFDFITSVASQNVEGRIYRKQWVWDLPVSHVSEIAMISGATVLASTSKCGGLFTAPRALKCMQFRKDGLLRHIFLPTLGIDGSHVTSEAPQRLVGDALLWHLFYVTAFRNIRDRLRWPPGRKCAASNKLIIIDYMANIRLSSSL